MPVKDTTERDTPARYTAAKVHESYEHNIAFTPPAGADFYKTRTDTQ